MTTSSGDSVPRTPAARSSPRRSELPKGPPSALESVEELIEDDDFVVVLPDWLDIESLHAPTKSDSQPPDEGASVELESDRPLKEPTHRDSSVVHEAFKPLTAPSIPSPSASATAAVAPTSPREVASPPRATLPDQQASLPPAKMDPVRIDAARLDAETVAIAETDVYGGDAIAHEVEHELHGVGEEETPETVSLGRLAKAVVAITLAGLGVLLMEALPYYQLGLAERPFHPFYSALRPSGSFGLGFALAGTTLMAISLLYLGRKYLVKLNWLGSLQSWLQFHIVAALVGSALILFHTNFVPTSAHGMLASVALVIILTSGALGRYVVAHAPKTLKGKELQLEGIQERLAIYRRKLIDHGVSPALLDVELAAKQKHRLWLIPGLLGMVWGDKQVRREYKKLRTNLENAGVTGGEVLVLARRLCRERHWLVRYRELRQIMGAWRFVHRWLSIVLLLSLLVHVGIALRFSSLLAGVF